MAHPINISDSTYKDLDTLRQKIPGKKRFESDNMLVTRILAEYSELKKKEDVGY
jgi:hypothetical protein